MTQHATHCRICAPQCGLLVTVVDGRVEKVIGDPEHPLTRGFTCTKGRQLGALHHAADRFTTAQRRGPNGLEPIATTEALDDVAAQLDEIRQRHGPGSIGLYIGTQSYTPSLTIPFALAWLRAVGSPARYSTMTLDQCAKWVAEDRLGVWEGGRQRFDEADVWLVAGANPLVSMLGADFTGLPIHDGLRGLEDARRRGLQLIVVDPRRTETASHADLHLQLRPGSDAALFAGLMHVILSEHLYDDEFCGRWVHGLEELEAAVAPLDPTVAAELTGVPDRLIVEAARTFGRARRGMAKSGTGPDMGPHADISEHLIQAMNVVCGRFPRAGERWSGSNVLSKRRRHRAQPVAPKRHWESSIRSASGERLMNGEFPSIGLPGDILDGGEGRLRALIVPGANPAAAFPDQDRIVEALQALDLLVTIDPFPSETARLSNYVFAPTMNFERWEDTRSVEMTHDQPFAQVSPPILAPPGDVLEDWEVFYELASRMGLPLKIGAREWLPSDPRPETRALLESFAGGPVAYDDVASRPRGIWSDAVPATLIDPPDPDAGRFELWSAEIAGEFEEALERISSPHSTRNFLLISRRVKGMMNSLGKRLPISSSSNPCACHPDDLDELSLEPGDRVRVASDHGEIEASVVADATLPQGVVSLTHCFGDLPEDDTGAFGVNPARLLSSTEDIQTVSRMPHLGAVPVTITRAVDPD